MKLNQEIHFKLNTRRHPPVIIMSSITVFISLISLLATFVLLVNFTVRFNKPEVPNQTGNLLNQPVIQKAITTLSEQTVQVVPSASPSPNP